jgi:hypothetical protein
MTVNGEDEDTLDAAFAADTAGAGATAAAAAAGDKPDLPAPLVYDTSENVLTPLAGEGSGGDGGITADFRHVDTATGSEIYSYGDVGSLTVGSDGAGGSYTGYSSNLEVTDDVDAPFRVATAGADAGDGAGGGAQSTGDNGDGGINSAVEAAFAAATGESVGSMSADEILAETGPLPIAAGSPSGDPTAGSCENDEGWYSTTGVTCEDYESNDWCTHDGGYGSEWNRAVLGSFEDWGSDDGVDATQACCACKPIEGGEDGAADGDADGDVAGGAANSGSEESGDGSDNGGGEEASGDGGGGDGEAESAADSEISAARLKFSGEAEQQAGETAEEYASRVEAAVCDKCEEYGKYGVNSIQCVNKCVEKRRRRRLRRHGGQ